MAGDYWGRRSKPYEPGQTTPYKISRSKIELFTQCPRCFWLEARLQIKRPPSVPLTLNNAVDALLKKEFDSYRVKAEPHPIMVEFGVKAIPFSHEEIDKWRQNFVGVIAFHKPTNLYVSGAVDDIWLAENGEISVVDYKATAKDGEVNLDAEWQIAYKNQMEIYQWLLRQNGFTVSDIGYFVYTNGRKDLDSFSNRVEFRTKIIPYKGDDDWVESTVFKMKDCLEGDMPKVGKSWDGSGICEYCQYAIRRIDVYKKYEKLKRPQPVITPAVPLLSPKKGRAKKQINLRQTDLPI